MEEKGVGEWIRLLVMRTVRLNQFESLGNKNIY